LEEQIRQIEEHIHRTKTKIGEGKEYSRRSQGDSDFASQNRTPTQNTGDVEISGHNTRHSWKSRQVEMM
jgi:hypothetical protein